MKKVLFLIFASLLVLGACGQEDDAKKDNDKKSESKSEQKSNDSKKDKKDSKRKDDKKSTEENNQSSEQNTNEQQTQENNLQYSQQTQQPDQNQQSSGALNQEQIKVNAKVAKQNGYTGVPNGDVGGVPTSDKAYSNDQLDPETGLPKDNVVPQGTE